MKPVREFHVVFVDEKTGAGDGETADVQTILYKGQEVAIKVL